MTHQVFIIKEEVYYVATNIVNGIASQGLSVEESLVNLKETIELYYKDNNVANNDEAYPAFLTTLGDFRKEMQNYVLSNSKKTH